MKFVSLSVFIISLCNVATASSRSDYHWVGVANIKYNASFTRPYTSQIVSITPSGEDSDSWYIEVGSPTCANSEIVCDDSLGVGRIGGSVKGGVEAFFAKLNTKFSVGAYYFEGTAKNLDSSISGRIFEKGTNLLAGYFELNPRHDGLDSFGFGVNEKEGVCFSKSELPSYCFGSGSP